MESIDEALSKHTQIKIDLLKISQCIQQCEEPNKKYYQNICLQYSEQLKELTKVIEKKYGVKLYSCCSFSDD